MTEEVTLEAINQQLPTGVMGEIKASGLVTIIDKDGKVKSTHEITSLTVNDKE